MGFKTLIPAYAGKTVRGVRLGVSLGFVGDVVGFVGVLAFSQPPGLSLGEMCSLGPSYVERPALPALVSCVTMPAINVRSAV